MLRNIGKNRKLMPWEGVNMFESAKKTENKMQ